MAALRVFITSKLKDGVSGDDFAEFGARASAMVADKEPGTVVYDWWLGEDGTVINEDGYSDEAAWGTHMENMGESGLLAEFMEKLTVTSVQVLGDVSDPTREAMTALGPVHYTQLHGR